MLIHFSSDPCILFLDCFLPTVGMNMRNSQDDRKAAREITSGMDNISLSLISLPPSLANLAQQMLCIHGTAKNWVYNGGQQDVIPIYLNYTIVEAVFPIL